MKKPGLFIIALMLLSIAGFSQKSTAYFNSKTSKQKVDDNTVIYNFVIDNIANENEKTALQEKLKKAGKEVFSVSASAINAQKVTYTVTLAKSNNVISMQNILLNAGIENVKIDDTPLETKKMADYVKAMKSAKK